MIAKDHSHPHNNKTRTVNSAWACYRDSQSRKLKKQTRLLAEYLGEIFKCIITVLNN